MELRSICAISIRSIYMGFDGRQMVGKLDVTQTAVIPAGERESNSIRLGRAGTLEGLTIRGGWTDSSISFVTSITEDGTYRQMIDAEGNLVEAKNIKANSFVTLNSRVTKGMNFFKLVSEGAVQRSERSIVLHITTNL